MLTANSCIQLLKSHDDILILTHRGPDGDTVGSAAALCLLLRQLGKKAFVMENPELTVSLRPFVEQCHPPEGFEPKFVVAVDIADTGLLPADAKHYAEHCDLCIDHHASNRLYAADTFLDADAAACAELIYALVRATDVELTAQVAEKLYLGLVTDTGCFRYPSVTAHTLRCAADCVETGIDKYAINREFIEMRSRKRLTIESAVLKNCTFSRDGAFALAWLDNKTLETFGAEDDDMTDTASFLRSIEGVNLSVFMRERDPGVWRISARSDPSIDVSAICAHFGGGGHRSAAGATAKLPIEQLLKAVADAVRAETDLDV